MTQQELISKIENQSIISQMYGKGTISKVRLSGSTIYFDIVFIVNGIQVNKSFSATIAVEKNVLEFENEETASFYNELKNTLVPSDKVEVPIIEKKIISDDVSSLKDINSVIKLFKNNESITQLLINNFDNQTFEETLCAEGFRYLEKAMNGYYLKDDCKIEVIILLSYLALKYYDGDLHTQIFSNYRKHRSETEYQFTDNSIRNTMYKILEPYRKEVQYFHDSSYNAVPIIYASVPHYRVSQLYKISYDIYKKKLLFDEDVSNDQIEAKVEECLRALKRKDLLSDSDSIKGTEYLMSKYTQSCIYSGFNLEALIKIISHCIRLIINHLTRHEDSFIVEPYYREGYDSWVDEFDNNTKEKTKYEQSRLLSRPYFKLQNQKYLYLNTGEYCMDDSYDPQKVQIEIYSNSKLIKTYDVDGPDDVLFNDDVSMGGYIIKRQRYLLDCSPIDRLSYKIVCDGEEIYSSKERLFRKVLFFDKNGNEVKPGTEYDGDIFVVSHTLDSNDEGGSSAVIVSKKEDYFISIFEVNSKEVFRFDNEPYVFFKIKDPKLIGYQVPWASFTTMEGKEEKIYKDISVLFQASCDKEDIYISVDDNVITFGEDNDINYRIYLFSNEYNGLFAYLIKIYGLDSGLHNIKIYNIKTNKMIKNSDLVFVYDDTLSKCFVSKTNESIIYETSSKFLNETISFDYPYGTSKLEYDAFVKGLGHGKLNVYPSTISYSIDGVVWHDIDWKFYLFELNQTENSIFVCGPNNLIPYVIDEKSTIRKRKLNYVQNDLDQFKYEINVDYLKTLKDAISLKISFEYGTRSKYLKVWYKPFIKNDSIIEYDKSSGKIKANILFEGKIKLWLLLSITNTENILHKVQISSGESIELDKNSLINHYDGAHYITASLHMPASGISLFKKYDEVPFKTFPKVCIDDLEVKVEKQNIYFNDVTSEIVVNTVFIGTNKLKMEICPSGFNKIIYNDEITSGKAINIKINKSIFNSFTILLFKPKINGGYEEKSFYTSKPIRTTSYFLKRRLQIKDFILDDNSKYQPNNNWINFIRIEQLDDEYYLLGNIVGMGNKIVLENVYVSPITLNSEESAIKIYRIKDNKKYNLKLKNGLKILSAILSMK